MTAAPVRTRPAISSEFHQSTSDGAVRLRAKVVERLHEATADRELRSDADIDALAELIEITWHGAMIRWAIHRDGTLVTRPQPGGSMVKTRTYAVTIVVHPQLRSSHG